MFRHTYCTDRVHYPEEIKQHVITRVEQMRGLLQSKREVGRHLISLSVLALFESHPEIDTLHLIQNLDEMILEAAEFLIRADLDLEEKWESNRYDL